MRKIILSILGVLLMTGSLFVAKKLIDNKNKSNPVSAKNIKTAFVDIVENGTVPIIITASGNLKAKRRVALYAEVEGIFKEGTTLFKTGQKYNANETLIQIDALEYSATVQSTKSKLYNLIIDMMPDLRLDYPRLYKKWQRYLDAFEINKPTPNLPRSKSKQEKYFITGKNIYTTYYEVIKLENRLKKYTISAPFNGVLVEALVTEGTLIRQGQKLGEFIDTNLYELEVALAIKYGDKLTEGSQVTLYNLDRTKTYTGKVSRINSSINQASQTITAFIEVNNMELREGIYLEAHLDAKNEENAIEIDRGLLIEENKIFVVKDDILDQIEVRPVYFSNKKVVLKDVPDGTVIISKNIPGAYVGMIISVSDYKKNGVVNGLNRLDSVEIIQK